MEKNEGGDWALFLKSENSRIWDDCALFLKGLMLNVQFPGISKNKSIPGKRLLIHRINRFESGKFRTRRQPGKPHALI